MFLKDLENFRKVTSSSNLTVSSHGDFTNVKVGISNKNIMNSETRRQAGILVEAYDDVIEKSHNIRFADHVLEKIFLLKLKKYLL